MKNTKKSPVLPQPKPNEEDIRDYARHLYEQTGCIEGRDLDNWLEAKTCLEANIPKEHSHLRLHRHKHSQPDNTATIAALKSTVAPAVAQSDA